MSEVLCNRSSGRRRNSTRANGSVACCVTTTAEPLESRLLAHELYCRKITASHTVCATVEKPLQSRLSQHELPAKLDHGRPRFRWLTPAKLDWSMSFQRGLAF